MTRRRSIMNKDILEGKWEQIKGTIQSKFGEITDDELMQIKGDSKKLEGYLQEKYGKTREEAEELYNEIFADIELDPATDPDLCLDRDLLVDDSMCPVEEDEDGNFEQDPDDREVVEAEEEVLKKKAESENDEEKEYYKKIAEAKVYIQDDNKLR